MNRVEIIFLLLALIFWLLGLQSLITFLNDLQQNTMYGLFSIWLLVPGAVLLLAAFQSKIKSPSADSEKT
ncbi:MAG: hypothetical protein ACFFDT_19230 [Candidatus Hodarchaeota archaeon]